ncbi:MAG: thiamine phosphate synthase [Candidatus Omnitrophica bacterium]|nr:thiamine phosphate synthase [Candidatus Omnitrophota bacterium]MBU1134723.1 thiamine phosphate synthase [Candidatus Omnitrophota bacterium]MBU1366756.1 thiamine phosphate synthase [Candidatus Omnitrophota bacterium]MBU1524142.1 thiamine phosphate synthase [Candidatus Omnitrophota bacterium]MBU1810139.1 thiamine phosphate synthase [Candidatus Omnitrophota bacterium]
MKFIPWKKKFLNSGLLYVILDETVIKEADRDIFSLADKLSFYGVDILQLRAKNIDGKNLLQLARNLAIIIHRRRKLFIVNDMVDIAYLANADGLHVGGNDLPVKEARKILGKKRIIGKTVHSQVELESFQKEEVDYLSIGPVFNTEIKPSLAPLGEEKLKNILSKAKKLTFAIGGINLNNINILAAVGIKNIAFCRAALTKNLKNTIGEFRQCLKKAS